MKNELLSLLAKNHYDFDLNNISIQEIGLVDKQTIYMIYKRRLLISDKVTQELVDNISFSQSDKLRLIEIKDKLKNEYLVFTNEFISEFIGIIKIS